MKHTFIFALFSVFVTGSLTCFAQSLGQLSSQIESDEHASIQRFLRTYLRDPYYDYRQTRYIAASIELNDKTPGAIVYLADQKSCGSSGCTTLILVRDHESYRVVTSIPAVWLPIRILESKTNGWHDIGVWVEGGGVRPGYESVLSFNGKTYPKNPTVAPARRVEHVKGQTVISRNMEATPLY